MRIEYGLACVFFGAAVLTFLLGIRALRGGDDVLGVLALAMGFVAVHATRRLVGEPGGRSNP